MKEKYKLLFSSAHSVKFVTIADIVYCQANGSYTKIFLVGNKSLMVTKPLKEITLLLAKNSFFRINKDCLVNLGYIDEYIKPSHKVVLTDKTELRLAFRRTKQFCESIMHRYGNYTYVKKPNGYFKKVQR